MDPFFVHNWTNEGLTAASTKRPALVLLVLLPGVKLLTPNRRTSQPSVALYTGTALKSPIGKHTLITLLVISSSWAGDSSQCRTNQCYQSCPRACFGSAMRRHLTLRGTGGSWQSVPLECVVTTCCHHFWNCPKPLPVKGEAALVVVVVAGWPWRRQATALTVIHSCTRINKLGSGSFSATIIYLIIVDNMSMPALYRSTSLLQTPYVLIFSLKIIPPWLFFF